MTPSAQTSARVLRQQALRDSLPTAAHLLNRRRAAEIAESDIDDYVALNWMEWNGGGLRLTATGENVCKQLTSRLV